MAKSANGTFLVVVCGREVNEVLKIRSSSPGSALHPGDWQRYLSQPAQECSSCLPGCQGCGSEKGSWALTFLLFKGSWLRTPFWSKGAPCPLAATLGQDRWWALIPRMAWEPSVRLGGLDYMVGFPFLGFFGLGFEDKA